MNILVLGGTRYFGKILVEKLLAKDNKVTIATRGYTKDNFGNKVERIVLDRTKEESLKDALGNKKFDLVYDNINYSSKDTKRLLDIINPKKYILVSSAAIYEFGENLKEESFDPYKDEIILGERKEFSYKEGKRQAERMLCQNYDLNYIIVRFPVVVGKNDYTRRLYSYVNNIIKEEPMYINNLKAKLSFISEESAGEFLAFLSNSTFKGIINAADLGYITIEEILEYIEEKTNKQWNRESLGLSGAYNDIEDCVLNISRAIDTGYNFKNIRKYMFDLIDYYLLSFTN